MNQEQFISWMAERLTKEGRGAKSKLAAHLGVEPSVISRLLTGDRSVSFDEAQSIIRFLSAGGGAGTQDVLGEGSAQTRPEAQSKSPYFENYGTEASKPGSSNRLQLKGEVAAGLWLEGDVFEGDSPEYTPLVGGDDRYPLHLQFLLRIRGQSLNLIAQDGDLILCLDYAQAGLELADGDLVVVERSRDGGHTLERTAKRLFKKADKLELHPQSNDPRFQSPLAYDEHSPEAAEVAIIAKVLWVLKQQ